MSEFDPEGFYENEWDGCGDLIWNEFDWERYLREQDDLVHRYLAHYETLRDHPDRIDEVAHLLGWDAGAGARDSGEGDDAGEREAAESAAPEGGPPLEPYTLHKNPVYVATRALYLSLRRGWERIAGDGTKVAQPMALAMLGSLHRGEEKATLGVQALDLGDYAMAVSLFKRALEELNRTLALAHSEDAAIGRAFGVWRDDALPRLFDLREIWLRVIAECRDELARRVDDES